VRISAQHHHPVTAAALPNTITVTEPIAASSTQETHTGSCNDIGSLISAEKSIDEICHTVGDLSNAQKYSLLYDHVPPPKILPSTFAHGCNRKFNINWLEKYVWLKYSPKLDGVFCGPCTLLLSAGNRRDKGLLVNKPFSNWVKLSDVQSNHSKSPYHRDAVQSADILKTTIETPTTRIDVMTNRALQVRMEQNKHILCAIAHTILLLAKQGLPFRGDHESVCSNKNPGNFLALLKLFAESDTVLHNHLYQPRARNATYLSPMSQNDIINVIGYDVVRSNIVDEIRNARFFSVMADEVSSHNEHMPNYVFAMSITVVMFVKISWLF
jgi:hypothetical protein